MAEKRLHRGLVIGLICCAGTIGVLTADPHLYSEASNSPRPLPATSETLGGSARYHTFLSTDKPIYHGGEKVYVRGVVLNAANHKPLEGGKQTYCAVQVRGPKGDVVAQGNVQSVDSVWGFSWSIPEDQAGGEYSLHATYPIDGHAPANRKFEIRSYRAPRLKSQITFLRDGYGPGDKVSATLDVKRAEGGVPEGARVAVNARVDGEVLEAAAGKVDARGLCTVTFNLPQHIARGEGTLALVIEDGGVVETASKTIPILLQTVDLQIYPEGGDLIAGFPNRVYIEAKQPNGKPADVNCRVMSKQSNTSLLTFHTEHEGRGRFEFTPIEGKEYFLEISKPAGIKTIYRLPAAKAVGAVLRSEKDVFKKHQPVSVKVGCTSKAYKVTLAKREVEISSHKIADSDSSKEMRTVSFDIPDNVDGVLTVTVWDKDGAPLAERLIYREPANTLNVSIHADKKSYVPGDTPKITVKTLDSSGKPVSALVGLTVTDDAVLEMVEKREQAPRLPVMVFLEPEVKDLADAQIYLDSSNPKSAIATDLLLSTQGWRRFSLMDLSTFVGKYGDQARIAVALHFQTPVDCQPPRGRMMEPNVKRAVAPAAVHMAKQEILLDQAASINELRDAPVKPASIAAAPSKVGFAQPAEKKDMGREQNEKLQSALERADKNVRGNRFLADGDELIGNFANCIAVREFAHQVRKDRKPTDRVDFAETLFWNTGIKTDAKTGEASVNFGLNDSVTTFKVLADAFTDGGEVGAANQGIESVQPFYAELKMPLEVSSGDRVLLPISMVNATSNSLSAAKASVALKGDFKLGTLQKHASDLAPGQRVRWLQPVNVGVENNTSDLVLTASAGMYQDKVTRKLSVKPKGFPLEDSFGGLIGPGKDATHTIVIPKGVVSASLNSNTAVYPSPLANLTEALQRMIQDPYGCFEQTSSTSYPLTMAQQYFLSHSGVDPKLVETSREKLDAGYKRLLSFWCPDRGYEWFGENPGHEALTAFGLLHFTDMSKVREVDANMINTTRSWLLKQRDGQGGFTRKRRSLHSWIEDKDCSNGYILWALLECGESPSELKKELASLKTAAMNSSNSYVTALAANAMFLSNDKTEANRLMKKLASKQKSDGSVDGIKSSIVGSGGESLVVEGTALATLAWLRDPAYAANVERSIKFLSDSCKGGRYGSTQATVLALRAIVTYDKLRAHPKAPGKVRLYVDGQSIGDWSSFSPSTQGAVKLPDMSELLTPGEHKLTLKMEGGATMPYSMAVKYNAVTPASSKDCKVDLSVKLSQEKVVEGNSTEANVVLTNKTKEALPTPVAIVGLPGGLEPRHDQLKELVKKKIIDAYEVRGRDVVLYWRTLPGGAKVTVPLSLIAAVPGTYAGPASRAYLYYTDEHKHWVDGVRIEISAK